MENVMLNSSQSQIKIVDFGLSNLWSAENPLRTHCGSPEYAAPELFITGKQYGAEVDLWSLGIILYGMVIGQLPFVTRRRGSASTSQERRKRLVAQINRGLATPHRRALAPFTPEFRSLMGRLLVADAAKRIGVGELAAHPWITERGKRLVRSCPLKEVDSNWKNKMIFEIATLLQLEKKLVLSTLSQDPLGKIGGMYNILKRRYQMSQLHGDGVTRSVPSVTLLELSDMTRGLGNIEKTTSTARRPSQKKPQTASSGRRADYYYTPRMIDLDKHLRQVLSSPNEHVMKNKPSQTNPKKRDQPPPAVPPKQRPSTVQPSFSAAAPPSPQMSRPLPDYRTIQSPNLRRKAYSATITPKTNRPFSPSQEVRDWGTKSPSKREEAGDEMRAGRKGVVVGSSRAVATQHSSDDHRKLHRAPPEQYRCHSEQSHSRKRPVTGPLQQFFERSLKTAGVAVSRSVSKTTEKYLKRNAKSTQQVRKREDTWEACGDTTARAVAVPYPPGRKPAIYDPIARSIADYVVNYVPHKLSSNFMS